ncbi:MAG TPA: hypothetical protein PLI20_01760 [Bacillota bacterium]|nr:hypothetical protein [Bacillota bacterium]
MENAKPNPAGTVISMMISPASALKSTISGTPWFLPYPPFA